jgi:general secretion pathway protein D
LLQNPRRFSGDVSGAGAANNGASFLNNITNFPGALPSGFSYFGKIGSELEVAVKAIANDSVINVISRPRIQTSHAIPGTFDVVQTVPYPSGSYDAYGYGGGFGGGFGGGGYTPRTIIERIDVGIRLGVTPFITPEGLVVMEIFQEASQVGADKVIDGNPIPVINKRTAEATLTVRNRDTIMMGGFITDSKSKSKSGVPILKDIPGLGVLFRSKNSDNSRSELIILMRATVLESPEAAAITAMEEKSQLPGIQQAEKQFQADDAKRRKKLKTSSKK